MGLPKEKIVHFADERRLLLYRFHLIVIAVNVIASLIALAQHHYIPATIEMIAATLLAGNIGLVRRLVSDFIVSILFFAIVAVELFSLIIYHHFGTMVVVFVLLLPLTVMLFIPWRLLMVLEAFIIGMTALLLYVEYQTNPYNPIVQHPSSLFHLAYVAIVIYIFGLMYHFAIQKSLRSLEASNAYNTLLLKEVYHRVKNNLNVVASIIGLQANRMDEADKEPFLKMKSRIESIALVHEMLYRSEDLQFIDFRRYAQRLIETLMHMYGSGETLEVEITASHRILSLDTAVQLGIIMNELLTNTIKYARFEGKGKVTIALRQEESHSVFEYKEMGTVVDIEKLATSHGVGYKLIHLSARQLRGDVTVENTEGLSYTIRFPHG